MFSCTEQTLRRPDSLCETLGCTALSLPTDKTIEAHLANEYYLASESIRQLPLDVLKYISDLTATGDTLKQEPARYSIQLGQTCRFWHTLSHLGAPADAVHLAHLAHLAEVTRLARLEDEALLTIWNRKLVKKFRFDGQPQPRTISKIKNWLEDPTNAGQINQTRYIKLKRLGIQDLEIQAIPPHISVFSNLRELDLHDNKIAAIPKEFGKLVNLSQLYLMNNKITALPKLFGNLVSLSILNLRDNNITEIPKEIGNLVRLVTLNFTNNNITEIPNEIGSLTNLQTLCLQNNKITALPKEFGNLVNLNMLYLQGNPLLLSYGKNELVNFDSRQEIVNFLSRINALNHYKCLSNLSQFIQFISQSDDPKLELIQAEFSKLETEDKNLIHEIIYQSWGVTFSRLDWKELNAFRLYRSVQIAIQKKFESLTQDEKNEVYGRIYDLAGRPVTADWQWGEHHAFENVLRLIDAMEK